MVIENPLLEDTEDHEPPWHDPIDNNINNLPEALVAGADLNLSYAQLEEKLGGELTGSLFKPCFSDSNWKHFTDKDKNENLGNLIEGELREAMQSLEFMGDLLDDENGLEELEEPITRLSRLHYLFSELSDNDYYRFAVGEESSPKTIIEHIDDINQRIEKSLEREMRKKSPFVKLASETNIVKPGTLLSTAIKQAEIKLLRENEITSLSPKRPTEDAALGNILSENNSGEDYLFFVSPELKESMLEDEWTKYKEDIVRILKDDNINIDLSKIDLDENYLIISFNPNQASIQLVKKLTGQARGQKGFVDVIIENYDNMKKISAKKDKVGVPTFVKDGIKYQSKHLKPLLEQLGIESDVHVSDTESGGSLYIYLSIN